MSGTKNAKPANKTVIAGGTAAVTADRKEYYHNYYLKRREELLARAKERNAKKSDPVNDKPRGRPAGLTFPNGYKKRTTKNTDEFENIQPTGALRSPPGNDKKYEDELKKSMSELSVS